MRGFWKGFIVVIVTSSSLNAEEISGFEYGVQGFELPSATWHIADYQMPNPLFDTDFSHNNLQVQEGLTLRLKPICGRKNRFLGASIRRQKTSGFGRYEAILKPAKGVGVVTGFFLYTGAAYGTQHDEIDIEFLGKDLTVLNLGWFKDGVLTQHQIPLNFNASTGFHSYAFEWRHNRISWFVDGRLVFDVLSENGQVPTTSGRLFANIWAVSDKLKDWAGHASLDTSATASFRRMKFTPLSQLKNDKKEEDYLFNTGGT